MTVTYSGEPLTILICEDEAIIALALEQALESMGHRVCGIVATADDAVMAACRYRPDLVMMDIMLRGSRDGIDAAREILAVVGIRSLFMTAVDAPGVRQRADQVKALGFLLKPYRSEELRRVLSRFQGAAVQANSKLAPAHAAGLIGPVGL